MFRSCNQCRRSLAAASADKNLYTEHLGELPTTTSLGSNLKLILGILEKKTNSYVRYHLTLRVYTTSYQEGLSHLVSSSTSPVGILMGVRQSDPTGHSQTAFCPSSPNWPTFMRINPILTWSYKDVWTFLHGLDLPYCSLYNIGYVSRFI